MMESIINSLDNYEIVCGVFIDLQKAFDTVNHDIKSKENNCFLSN